MRANAKRLIFSSPILLLFGLMLFDLGLVARSGQTGKSSSAMASRRMQQTDELFRRNCARCHGADGRGDTPSGHTYHAPNFTDEGWWLQHSNIISNRRLTTIVTRGKGGMPAFGKKLARVQIKQLVNYVRRFKNQAAPAGS